MTRLATRRSKAWVCLPVADDHTNGGLLRPSDHQEIATGWIRDVSLAEISSPMVEEPHGSRDAAPLIRRLCPRSFCEGAPPAENENDSDEGAARERGRRGLEERRAKSEHATIFLAEREIPSEAERGAVPDEGGPGAGGGGDARADSRWPSALTSGRTRDADATISAERRCLLD